MSLTLTARASCRAGVVDAASEPHHTVSSSSPLLKARPSSGCRPVPLEGESRDGGVAMASPAEGLCQAEGAGHSWCGSTCWTSAPAGEANDGLPMPAPLPLSPCGGLESWGRGGVVGCGICDWGDGDCGKLRASSSKASRTSDASLGGEATCPPSPLPASCARLPSAAAGGTPRGIAGGSRGEAKGSASQPPQPAQAAARVVPGRGATGRGARCSAGGGLGCSADGGLGCGSAAAVDISRGGRDGSSVSAG